MNRRNFITKSGQGLIGSAMTFAVAERALALEQKAPEAMTDEPRSHRQVKVIVIGAGDRGNTYSRYAAAKPDLMQIVGVAEPNQIRRERFAEKFKIASGNQLNTWEDVFKKPKWADAVIITTPDRLHYAPAMKAISMGYHVLVEKPISVSLQECEDIAAAAQKAKVIAATCHVLRYAPYFRQLKAIIDSGQLGDIASIDHLEPVGYWHMAHSFVRGNWRNEKGSTFMLLAKSCHDLDIIRWMVGKPCRQVSSMGSLMHFKKENAPEGSTLRCTDGCKVEATCPYSAPRIYMNPKYTGWPVSVITTDMSPEGRMKALKEGPYGRCVYHCDNDVVDHQLVNMQFEGGTTASFTMAAFTPQQGMGMRKTRIMGTKGYLEGNMQEFTLTDFATNEQKTIDTRIGGGDAASGHGGGDGVLIANFIEAVATGNESLLTSTIAVSVESHRMAFRAEESRLKQAFMTV